MPSSNLCVCHGTFQFRQWQQQVCTSWVVQCNWNTWGCWWGNILLCWFRDATAIYSFLFIWLAWSVFCRCRPMAHGFFGCWNSSLSLSVLPLSRKQVASWRLNHTIWCKVLLTTNRECSCGRLATQRLHVSLTSWVRPNGCWFASAALRLDPKHRATLWTTPLTTHIFFYCGLGYYACGPLSCWNAGCNEKCIKTEDSREVETTRIDCSQTVDKDKRCRGSANQEGYDEHVAFWQHKKCDEILEMWSLHHGRLQIAMMRMIQIAFTVSEGETLTFR